MRVQKAPRPLILLYGRDAVQLHPRVLPFPGVCPWASPHPAHTCDNTHGPISVLCVQSVVEVLVAWGDAQCMLRECCSHKASFEPPQNTLMSPVQPSATHLLFPTTVAFCTFQSFSVPRPNSEPFCCISVVTSLGVNPKQRALGLQCPESRCGAACTWGTPNPGVVLHVVNPGIQVLLCPTPLPFACR